MRLNRAVRDALAQIIDTLNLDTCHAAACTVAAGLFIPLVELERRKIEPSLALRALAEVNMLVKSPGTSSQTVSHEFGQSHEVGLVLNPRFVEGLDPEHFNAPHS
jgi:conjugal transfer pilus assembly protein TraI